METNALKQQQQRRQTLTPLAITSAVLLNQQAQLLLHSLHERVRVGLQVLLHPLVVRHFWRGRLQDRARGIGETQF